MGRYESLQLASLQVQVCNSLKHGIACDSMPVTKVRKSIPGEEDSIWIIGYGALEFQQC